MGLADALFTTTQQRVLSILFGQPERSFLQKEIIELAGGGSGAVRRELDRLTASGLVKVATVGAQKHYQADRGAPLFEELRSIVRKTVGVTNTLREALRPLKRRVDLALVYGSVARGEERAGSDIDLLVVGDEVRLEELFSRLAPLEKKLGRRVSPTLYTRADYERRRSSGNPFLKKVLAGETIVLIGSIERNESESR